MRNSLLLILALLSLTTACVPKIRSSDLGTLDVTAGWRGAGRYLGYDSSALPANRVCTGSSIFGEPGTAVCGAVPSNFSDLMSSQVYRSDNASIDFSDPAAVAARSRATLADEGAGNVASLQITYWCQTL